MYTLFMYSLVTFILAKSQSAVQFQILFSPHFWIKTASVMCLVRTVGKKVTGLRCSLTTMMDKVVFKDV